MRLLIAIVAIWLLAYNDAQLFRALHSSIVEALHDRNSN